MARNAIKTTASLPVFKRYAVAVDPISNYWCPEGRIVSIVWPSVWKYLHLAERKDHATPQYRVSIESVDFSILNFLVEIEDKCLSRHLPGVGPYQEQKLKTVREYFVSGQIFKSDDGPVGF